MRYSREVLDAVAARAKEASPEECSGMISGVRTRRGVEIVALHEFGVSSDEQVTTGASDVTTLVVEDSLVLRPCERSKLMAHLEAAGTPVVCMYRSRVGSRRAISDEEEVRALGAEGPGHPGVEYLVLSIDERELNAARAFTWDGRTFIGREVRLEGE